MNEIRAPERYIAARGTPEVEGCSEPEVRADEVTSENDVETHEDRRAAHPPEGGRALSRMVEYA